MNNRLSILAGLAIIALASACQKQPVPVMDLSTKEIEVSADGEVVTFDLTTNVYYRVNNDCVDDNGAFWAEISEPKTNGEVSTFTLTVKPNPKQEIRSASIRFIGDGVTPLALTITQKAMVPVGVSVPEISVGFTDTSAEFTVLGDKSWTAVCDKAEFVLSATQGTGEKTVSVTFPQNTGYDAINATVTVTIAGKDYTVKITQNGTPKPEYIDLSATATANCYIIDKAGNYMFSATARGNKVVPTSQTLPASIEPASVKVLWSTFNTGEAPTDDNAIIKDVTLDKGFVKFKSASISELVQGNVVIAALNAEGEIIWSWHVWATTPVSDVNFKGVTWMDRNLGALAPNTYQTKDPLACGLLYQWGRKDPMRGSRSYAVEAEGNDIATTGTWPAPQVASEENGSIDFTIKNPQLVIYAKDRNHNNKDWIWGTQYDDLWGGGDDATVTKKTMFDPCPAGYCVPTAEQTQKTGFTKDNIQKDNSGLGSSDFWFTYAGGIGYDTGTIINPGLYCYYATSTTSSVNSLCIRSHSTAMNLAASSGRTAGYSIRCVKEQ